MDTGIFFQREVGGGGWVVVSLGEYGCGAAEDVYF